MNPNASKLFDEFSKYEKEGTDSMEWAEYGCHFIDEMIEKNFTESDWNDVDKYWKSKSNNIKALLANHLDLSELNFACIQLKILTNMVMNENEAVAFEALRRISFGIITSGIDNTKNHYYSKKELKGIFKSENSCFLINQYFDVFFITKVMHIAEGCSESWKNEFLEFLKVIKQIKLTFTTRQL